MGEESKMSFMAQTAQKAYKNANQGVSCQILAIRQNRAGIHQRGQLLSVANPQYEDGIGQLMRAAMKQTSSAALLAAQRPSAEVEPLAVTPGEVDQRRYGDPYLRR
jgi:hypothetical protein